jgi:predicted metalloprotease
MRWRGRAQSGNVVDRRGRGARVGGALGGGGILLVLLYALLGGDVSTLLGDGGGSAPPTGQHAADQREFVGVVLRDTEDVWHALFRQSGAAYREPKLVLFTGSVRSACGTASSAVGPFYCPGDEQVYIDMDFFEDLQRKLDAGGDFTQAYVIAHEVGHHVQHLLGTSDRVHAQQQRLGQTEANRLSVRLELQADCYAGVYAHQTQREKQVLEPGDIEEALNAAAAIGDDRLQRRAGGEVVPDSFTHGTSAQRAEWFRRGYDSGNPAACDTFESLGALD